MIVEFSRRKFLVAAGGSALALPVLEAFTPKKARAALDKAQRIIFIVTVNGSPRESRPTGDGPGYTLGPILSGLEKHKDQMLFVGGLDSQAAILSNGDPHACGFATTLSGMKALEGTEFKHGACFMDANCRGTGWGDGPSVDQIIAKAHLDSGAKVVHGSLNFAIKNTPGSLYTRMSYSAPGEPLVPEADPSAAFDRIFGNVSVPTGDPAAVERVKLRKGSALDEVAGELVALQGRIGAADKARLEQHLTSLRSLEERIKRMTGGGPAASCKPPERPTLGAGNLVERNPGGMETNINADKTDNVLERNKIWQAMAIQALACDLTRVVTIMTAPSRADTFMPWLKDEPSVYTGNFDKPHHQASHDNDRPTLTSMDHWYATRVSSYVDDLKATLDANGNPLFDSTGIAWFNELGSGPDHSHVDKPHVLIGSFGGYFKTGQKVTYPKGTPHNILLTAIAQAMGVETDHIGGQQQQLKGGDINLLKA